MAEEEFRRYQITRDQKTLEEKVRRWKQLQPVTYGQTLPQLMWDYINKAVEMFIDGHSIGAVLLCAAITELVLADRLMSTIPMTRDEVGHFSLEQMAMLAHRLEIVTDQERDTIDDLRKLRNALVHANAGKITKMAKRCYGDSYGGVELAFFLTPLSNEGGISSDVIKSLRFTRDLTFRFYGAEP